MRPPVQGAEIVAQDCQHLERIRRRIVCNTKMNTRRKNVLLKHLHECMRLLSESVSNMQVAAEK